MALLAAVRAESARGERVRGQLEQADKQTPLRHDAMTVVVSKSCEAKRRKREEAQEKNVVVMVVTNGRHWQVRAADHWQ